MFIQYCARKTLQVYPLALLASCVLFLSSCTQTAAKGSRNASTHETVSRASSLTLTIPFDPGTVDPRKIRDLSQVAVSRSLYSGLLRLDAANCPVPDIAENVVAENQGRSYLCTIHPKAVWSDATPITAHDVRASWISSLNAKEACPNASMLFIIKNGKRYYDGTIQEDEVGIEVIDDATLRVSLEQPCPYFPQLLTTYPFFILPASWLEKPSLSNQIPPSYGPFVFDTWNANQSISVKKNPLYRFASSVLYDHLTFEVVNDQTALVLFENNDVDWAGSPLSFLPLDAIPDLKRTGAISTAPAFTTTFLRVNTTREALKNPKMRRALSHAIDRKSIVDHVLQGSGKEATQLVPPLCTNPYAQSRSTSQSLNENDFSSNIRLTFPANDRSSRIAQAIQHSVQKKLPLMRINLDPCEPKHFYSRVRQGDYDIALGSWVADYLDPDSFYAIFETKLCGTNNTGWESSDYTSWFIQSRQTSDEAKRQEAFMHMEEILSRDCPVIPLFYNVYMFLKSDRAQYISVSPMGIYNYVYEDPSAAKKIEEVAHGAN